MLPELFPGVDLGISAAIRAYCGWHIAPSITETVTLDGSGSYTLPLPTLHLTALSNVLNDGVAVTPEWSEAGFARLATTWRETWDEGPSWSGRGWTTKLRGVTLTMTHGFNDCPGEIMAVHDRLSMADKIALSGGTVRIGQVSVSGSTSGNAHTSGMDPYCAAILDRYRIPARA